MVSREGPALPVTRRLGWLSVFLQRLVLHLELNELCKFEVHTLPATLASESLRVELEVDQAITIVDLDIEKAERGETEKT